MSTDKLRQRRYQLVPQMEAYDRLAASWVPHAMISNEPSFIDPVCSTDEFGFRTTHVRGESLSYRGFAERSGTKSLLCGASTAFGVGASNDESSVASKLNAADQPWGTWFNMGVRGHSSTQEALTFALFQPIVENVVILSGVNSLILEFYQTQSIWPLTSFFWDDLFHRLKQPRSAARTARRSSVPHRRPPRRRSAPSPEQTTLPRKSTAAALEDVTARLQRDLELWAALRDRWGFRLTFVLQPVAHWIDREPAAEEAELFEILALLGNKYWEISSILSRELYGLLAASLESKCRERNIGWIDLNLHLRRAEWLFCDHVHLNDTGQALIADELITHLA